MGNEQYRNTTGHEKGGDINVSKKIKAIVSAQLEIQPQELAMELFEKRKKELSNNPLLLVMIFSDILAKVKKLIGKGMTAEEIKASEKIKF